MADYNPTVWVNNVTPINATNLNHIEGGIDLVDQAQREYPLKKVYVATTGNVTLSGEQTIDGTSVVSGKRVLVWQQTTGSQNGIYVCSTGAWARAEDADSALELSGGTLVSVERGTLYGGHAFILTNAGSITIGSTSLTFGAVGGGGGPASASVLGSVKVSTTPVDSNNPIAVGDNDARVPTTGENDALAGTNGTPSSTNRYLTDTDPRNTNGRAPTGTAGGSLAGSYPNPTLAAGAVPTSTGSFQASHAYIANDLFTANGATFRVKQAWTSGTTAPDPTAGDTANYEVWAAPGEVGAPAIMVAEDAFGGYVDLDVVGTKVYEDSFGGYTDLDLFPAPSTGGSGGDAATLGGQLPSYYAVATDTATALNLKLDEGVFDDHLTNTATPQHTAPQILVLDAGARFTSSPKNLENVLSEIDSQLGAGTGVGMTRERFNYPGVLVATQTNADGTGQVSFSGSWVSLFLRLDVASTLGAVSVQIQRMNSHTAPFTWTTIINTATATIPQGQTEVTLDLTALITTSARAFAPTDVFRCNLTAFGQNARNLWATLKGTVAG